MATLSLTRRRACSGKQEFALLLKDWLQGDWGLLFSHPADFAHTDLEADRWLAVVQDALAQAHIRPFAAESDQPRYGTNWIEEINGRDTAVFLDDELPSYSDEMEFNSIVLASAISRAPARFVMILDHQLRLRRTFTYSKGNQLPSVLDFIATVEKLTAATSIRNQPSPINVSLHQPPRPKSLRVSAHA
jgi:alkyl hydroperoxide reductase subunit AhpC